MKSEKKKLIASLSVGVVMGASLAIIDLCFHSHLLIWWFAKILQHVPTDAFRVAWLLAIGIDPVRLKTL